MLTVLLLARYGALLGDVVTLSSPCSSATAATVCKEALSSSADDYWVAVTNVPTAPKVDFDAALLTAPASIQGALGVPRMPIGGEPFAVGRLRRHVSPPMIDCLRSSLPKEDKLHADAIGLVIDALLLAWAEWLSREAEASKLCFETLTASSSLACEAVLVQRGFMELDTVDFTAKARGEPLATHSARLPSALLSAKARAAQPGTEMDQAHLEGLVEALRSLEPPTPSSGAEDDGQPQTKSDPWSGIKGARSRALDPPNRPLHHGRLCHSRTPQLAILMFAGFGM